MKKIRVIDSTKKIEIVKEAEVADTFFLRWRGLMGRKELKAEQGLLLDPCNSIHTIGMKISLDVIFLDRENVICHTISDLKPGKVSPIIFKAKRVLEMKGGTIKRLQIVINDQIELIE